MPGTLSRSLIALVLAAPLASAGSTTWFVDVNGTPPGTGTPGDPYTSLQHALDQATTTDLDTLVVLPGVYAEHVDFNGKRVAVVASAGPELTRLEAVGAGAVVTMDAENEGLGGCSLEGFTITGAVDGAPGVLVPGAAFAEATLRRCILRGNDGPGVLVGYDVLLFECTVTGNARALQATGSGCVRVSSSILWGNAADLFLGPCINLIEFTLLEAGPDPRFWDAAGGDLRLRADSPAIDAGDPSTPLDPDGSVGDQGALPFDAAYAPGTARFCFGSADLCPCGNGGSGDAGCDLPQATGGIALGLVDFLPDGAGGGTAELVGAGYPPAAQPAVTLIRSPGAQTPPVAFGDGLRCIATTGLVRIGAVLAGGGASSHAVSHGAGAGTFRYQLWSRSTLSAFCTPAAFNLSNALEIAWP